jgi:hypothetical protein
MTVNADTTRVPNPAATDPAAYPLTKVDYAMAPTEVPTAAKAEHLKSLLTALASTAQADLPDGYVALPDALVTQSENAVAAIKATGNGPNPPEQKPPGPTPSPTTTTDTTPLSLGPSDTLGSTNFADTPTDSSAFSSDTGGGSSYNSDGSVNVAGGQLVDRGRGRGVTTGLAAYTPIVSLGSGAGHLVLPIVFAFALFIGLLVAALAAKEPVGSAASRAWRRVRSHGPPAQSEAAP